MDSVEEDDLSHFLVEGLQSRTGASVENVYTDRRPSKK